MIEGRVSVIIPNYNYEHYLNECIDSVLAQTYPDTEIIVVDDGSKDGSRSVIESYNGRLRGIFQQNAGVSAARNNGVAASTGEFIAFLDADDSWLPRKLERQVARSRQEPDLGLVHVGVAEVDPNGNLLVERFEGVEGDIPATLLRLRREGVLGGGSGIMTTRRVFDAVGGFDGRLSTSADWDLFYRISERYQVGFVPEILVKYRIHTSNMHGNVEAMEHDMTLAFENAFAAPRPEIAAIRSEAYGRLYLTLAGSYYNAGNYSSFVSCSIKSLYYDPRNIGQFLRLKRGSSRRGVKADG